MKEVKELEKLKIITYDGYKIACFEKSKDETMALDIIKEKNLDVAVLANKSSKKGYVFHFITHKNINVLRLTNLLVEFGKTNNLYWEYTGVVPQKMTSARVYAANLNLIR